MERGTRIEGKIIPALDMNREPIGLGNITSVPTIPVSIGIGQFKIHSLGIVDTGADLCMINEVLFLRLSKQVGRMNIARSDFIVGVHGRKSYIYYLDLTIPGIGIGDERIEENTKDKQLSFTNVPVVVSTLGREVFTIGRSGVLEKLRVEIDFPRAKFSLILDERMIDEYPMLSSQLPGFQRAYELMNKDSLEQGVLYTAMELEKLLDRLILARKLEKDIGKPIERYTLGDKLLIVSDELALSDIKSSLDIVGNYRNRAAHLPQGQRLMSKDVFLTAVEEIVSRIVEETMGNQNPFEYGINEASDKVICWRRKTKEEYASLSIEKDVKEDNPILVLESKGQKKIVAVKNVIKLKSETKIESLTVDNLPVFFDYIGTDKEDKTITLRFGVNGFPCTVSFDYTNLSFRKIQSRTYRSSFTILNRIGDPEK